MAEENVTTRFSADVTDFKSAMQEANRSIQLANSEFNALSSSMDENTSEQDKLLASTKRLTTIRDAEARKLAILKNEYEKVAAEQGESSAAAQKLLVRVNNQTASLNKAEKALKTYTEGLDDTNKAQEDAAKGASKFSDNLSSLAGTALKGVSTGIVGLAAAAAGAVASFFALAESTREYRTEMGKLETAFTTSNLTAEDATKTYTELYGILGDTGKATEASQQLAQLANSEEELNDMTHILTGVYAKFGDSLAVEGLAEAMNHTAKLGEVQGTLADALEWSGITVEDFNAQLAEAGTEAERQALITSTLNGLYGEAADTYKEVNKDIIAANEAQAKLTDSTATLGAAAEGITTVFKDRLANVLVSITPLVQQLTEAFTAFLNGDYSAGVEMISNVFDQVGNKAGELFNNLIEKVSELLPKVLPKIAELLTTLLNKLIEFAPTLLDGAIKLLNAIVDAIPPTIKAILKALPSIISNLLNFFIQNYPKIVKAGYELIAKLIAGIIGCIPDVVGAAGDIIGTIFDTFMETDWLELGLDIMQGILDGMMNIGSAIGKTVKKLGKKIKDGFTDFFDIHSPSRLMSDEVGKYIGLGVLDGIEESMVDVQKGLQSSLDGLTSNINLDANGVRSSGAVYNLNYTVNSPKAVNRFENWQQSKKMLSLLKGGAV